MSRHSARTTSSKGAGTPIWVWVVYGLGLLAVTVLVGSALFALGASLASDEVTVGYDVSAPALILWGGLVLLAAATWFWRRRGARR